MLNRLQRALSLLELEERILNGGALVTAIGVFLPWMSGEWLGGEDVTYTGLGFFTSFLGLAVLLLHLFILAVTVVPLAGGPIIIKRKYIHMVRLVCACQAAILALASLSVLTKVTLEFTRIEVRFGLYVTIIGSLITALYAFLQWQEQRRSEVREFFHHPEDPQVVVQEKDSRVPPPPPPPPPPAPKAEEHHLR